MYVDPCFDTTYVHVHVPVRTIESTLDVLRVHRTMSVCYRNDDNDYSYRADRWDSDFDRSNSQLQQDSSWYRDDFVQAWR